MKLDITDHHFIELHKKGYTMDMVVILDWANRGLSLDHIIGGSKKIEAIHNTMLRKGLLTDENKITAIGAEILTFISKKTNRKFEKPKVKKGDFDKWWSVFPSNDKFEIGNRKFGPTRSFKTLKEDCRLMFNKMVLDKEFTAQEIIDATLYDVNLKKKRSYTKNSNQLKYLQNSATYLRQKTFMGFVGMGTGEDQLPKSRISKGSIDI